jgi:purine nucleosidase
MVKVLIDADTGIDDSIAILYALKNPKVRVVAISTACGNTDALQAAENTIRLIKLAQPAYPVPVAVGANKPLKGDWGGPVPHIHGDNGIGNVLLPPSEQKAVNEDAVDLILRLSRENAGELVLVALGRLTNIALAFEGPGASPQDQKNRHDGRNRLRAGQRVPGC